VKRVEWMTVALALLFCVGTSAAQIDGYPPPNDLNRMAEKAAKAAGGDAMTLTETMGGYDLLLATVGADEGTAPAIFVVANLEGNRPLESLASIRLLEKLDGEWKGLAKQYTWYVIPLGNPDGYTRLFDSPVDGSAINARPVNADKDNAEGEDGPDDLNGDGVITVMRQKHPEGKYVAVGAGPLLRKADPGENEIGVWRLLPEGLDNDGDGEINEDGPGGVLPAHNFPHEFEHYTADKGLFSASERESRAIMQFAFDHPEISMTLHFGSVNTLAKMPPTDKKGRAAEDEYEVPERWAQYLGFEPKKKYPIDEIVQRVRDAFGSQDISEDRVLQWLGAGAMVNPDREDQAWWKQVNEKYEEYFEEAAGKIKLIDPPRIQDGSFEEWAYYQYGVPSFGLDFWTPAKAEKKKDDGGGLTPDSIETMSNEDFLALPEDTLANLQAKISSDFTVEQMRKGFEAGMIDTKKFAQYLRDALNKNSKSGDELEEALYAYDPSSYVEWTSYEHPELGMVDIGGLKPLAADVPRFEDADSLINVRLPFIVKLVGMLPDLSIGTVDVKEVTDGVYRIEAWAVNQGMLPYPTHQGARSQRPMPAVFTMEGKGITFLEGRAREVLGLIDGARGVENAKWLVSGKEGAKVTLELKSAVPEQKVVITLTEGGGR
jgi:hypothetical protein